ncbi:MAG: TPM domain-containing protein [Candidatus Aminicenantales bacterium]
MRRYRTGLLVFAALLCFGLSGDSAADIQVSASPNRWVTDTADLLTSETVRALNRKLEDYEKQTGHQIIVYIGKTTGGSSIEEFADKAFQSWAVGRKGLDDGAALFIMAEDRKIRLEVGYGLEGVIPDIIVGRIINDILLPKFRTGDTNGAVSDAVAAIVKAISGEAVPTGQEPGEHAVRRARKSIGQTVLIAIGIIALLILFITNPSLAVWLLISFMSGGGGGGRGRGFGGGGGFRGGGGRSGGGGASGGW